MSCKILVSLLLSLQLCDSANILFYHHVASYSHRVVTYPLADALAKRGHQVTFLSPFSYRGAYKNPNITEIVPKKFAAAMSSWLAHDFDVNFRIKRTLPNNIDQYYPIGIEACQILLESEELREYLENTPHLDLMIADDCLTECGMGLIHKYRSKHIIFSTVTVIPGEHDIFGMIPDSAAIPEMEMFAFRTPMSFLDKVANALISINHRYVHYTHYIPQIDQIIRRNMKECEDMPFVDDMFRNSSLVLYTGDLVSDYPRALPPNFVNIGGIHCPLGERKELPKELKQFVEDDSNSDGVVYISLGSFVVAAKLPEEIKQMFFETMEQFPKLKFLWRWSGEKPGKIPKNLYIDKWFPQNDILAHPMLKAFVTQNGRPGTLEGLCAAMPMISFPILGDQDIIANRLNEMGGNVHLEIGTLTQKKLYEAVKTAVYDPHMKQRMIQLKAILNDKPLSSLDTAVWWTEYVLRHNDTNHLKPAGFHQWWYERRLLDVWAFIFLIMFIIGMVVLAITVTAFKLMLKVLLAGKLSTKLKKS